MFLVTQGAATYTSEAEPGAPGSTGTRGFCSDQNLVLYWVATGAGFSTCVTTSATPL